MKNEAVLETFCKSYAVKQAQNSTKVKEKYVPINPKIELATKEMISIMKFTQPGVIDFESFICSWKESKGTLQSLPCSDPRNLRIIEFGITIDFQGGFNLLVSTETVIYHV